MTIEVDDKIGGILTKEAETKGISTDSLLGDLLAVRYQQFKTEVQAGFDDFDNGKVSERSADDIANAVLAKHQ